MKQFQKWNYITVIINRSLIIMAENISKYTVLKCNNKIAYIQKCTCVLFRDYYAKSPKKFNLLLY